MLDDSSKRRRRMLKLCRENDLTHAGVADLAGKGTSIKTVHAWLQNPGTAGYRPIPAHRLELIEINIRLAAAKKTAG